jgi:PAS domain S-box-containing protein
VQRQKRGVAGHEAPLPVAPAVPERDIASLRAMLDGTPLSLHVRDRQGRLVACNAAFLALHEATFEALRGTYFDALDGLPPETARALHERYLERVRTGQPVTLERCELERHGRRTLLHVWATPWRGDDGALLGMVCGALDVTGREDMLKALALERDGASAVLAGTNRLVQALCDELEPVAGLLHEVEARLREAPDAQLASVAGATAKRIERFARGVTDLLAFEAGRPGFAVDRVLPAALTREIVEALRPECEARGCALTLNVSGDEGTALRLDGANFERVAHLLIAQQVVRWPGCALAISLELGDAGPGLCRLTLAITALPRETEPPGAKAGHAGALAQAGGHLALILCRRYVELMHGVLQGSDSAAASTRVAMELLLPAY